MRAGIDDARAGCLAEELPSHIKFRVKFPEGLELRKYFPQLPGKKLR